METAKPILFIGAADGICREAVRLFAKATNVPLLLADADEDAVRRLATSLSRKNVFTKKLDLFDAGELRTSIADVALVVQGAQPYYRTSTYVLRACIESKTPYLDFSDDVSSTQESLDLQDEAKKAGVPCYINCGSSPGITNLMAVQICSELDDVQRIDICWLVSEEGGALGREVLEHLMHITGGPCLSWADGHAVVHENWVEKDYAPIKPDVNVLFHESVHPEPVTLPRRFPQVNRIRTMGALNPVPYNGFARGLGAAVHAGTLSMDDAVDFLINLQKGSSISWSEAYGAFTAQLRGGDITLNQLVQLASHSVSTLKPWNHAIWGMIKQVRNGECSITDVVKFLVNSTLGKKAPHQSGMLVRGVGTRHGHPAVLIKRGPDSSEGSALGGSMATSIGACCAAFILLALEQGHAISPGVHCPEDWTNMEAFNKCFERVLSENSTG